MLFDSTVYKIMANNDKSDDQENLNLSLDEEISPRSMDNETGAVGGSASEEETEAKKQRTQMPSPRPIPAFMVAASPPKFITFDQLMAAANGVTNMAIAHEIAVDSDFTVERLQPEPTGLQKQVDEIARRAFFDLLQERLNTDPPDYSQALVLIAEIRGILEEFITPKAQRLKQQIAEVLDMDLLKQKMEHGAFDIHYYMDFVVKVMARLCAPVRDADIAQLQEIKEVVPFFKAVYRVLDLMRKDMANFTIQQIRPFLQQRSVEYEREKFREFLATQEEIGVDGLEMTKAWLERTYQKMQQQQQQAEEEEAKAATVISPCGILNQAYLQALQWEGSPDQFPETLLMDRSRLEELQRKLQHTCRICSILLVTYSTVGSPIAGLHDLKVTLKDKVEAILKDVPDEELGSVLVNVAEQVRQEVSSCLVQHGYRPLSQDNAKVLVGQIQDIHTPGNAVAAIMKKRVLEFLSNAISVNRVDQLKVPPGFSAIETQLTQILGKFLQLISHNRSVFGPFYADIIGKLINRQQDGELSPRKTDPAAAAKKPAA